MYRALGAETKQNLKIASSNQQTHEHGVPRKSISLKYIVQGKEMYII